MKTPRTPSKTFRGLNTVADPYTLGISWLRQADNCVIDGRGKMQRAQGFTQRAEATAITGAYATQNFQRLYLVDDGSLVQVHSDLSRRVLATGLSSAPMRFAEINGVVYGSNGFDFITIDHQGVRQWGIGPPAPIGNADRLPGKMGSGLYRFCCVLRDDRGMVSSNSDIGAIHVSEESAIALRGIPQVAGYETDVYVTKQNGDVFHLLQRGAPVSITYNHAPDDLGDELPFLFANHPHGILPAFFAGRAWLADPYPTLDVSMVWRSFPLNYHLFDDGSQGITVPGRVLMLQSTATALIIGTDRAVYSLDEDDRLTMLAPYGVVPGDHASTHRGQAFFWTLRGLCRALPFENLTESTISVAPGTSACAAVLEQDGFRRFFVALHRGGQAFNPRS